MMFPVKCFRNVKVNSPHGLRWTIRIYYLNDKFQSLAQVRTTYHIIYIVMWKKEHKEWKSQATMVVFTRQMVASDWLAQFLIPNKRLELARLFHSLCSLFLDWCTKKLITCSILKLESSSFACIPIFMCLKNHISNQFSTTKFSLT